MFEEVVWRYCFCVGLWGLRKTTEDLTTCFWADIHTRDFWNGQQVCYPLHCDVLWYTLLNILVIELESSLETSSFGSFRVLWKSAVAMGLGGIGCKVVNRCDTSGCNPVMVICDATVEPLGSVTAGHFCTMDWMWISFQGDDQQVKCRYDWHQTSSNVVVSVFAKKYDPDRSFVELNPIRLKVHLFFPEERSVFDLDVELWGVRIIINYVMMVGWM